MQVAKQLHGAVGAKALHHSLHGDDGGVEIRLRVPPAPVEVHACQGAPVIPCDDAIRVQHGHDLEDEVLA